MNIIVWNQDDKRIWQTEDGFVIAESGCWLPGCYKTIEAAKIAFEFSDDVLQRLQDSIAPEKISQDDLNKEGKQVNLQ